MIRVACSHSLTLTCVALLARAEPCGTCEAMQCRLLHGRAARWRRARSIPLCFLVLRASRERSYTRSQNGRASCRLARRWRGRAARDRSPAAPIPVDAWRHVPSHANKTRGATARQPHFPARTAPSVAAVRRTTPPPALHAAARAEGAMPRRPQSGFAARGRPPYCPVGAPLRGAFCEQGSLIAHYRDARHILGRDIDRELGVPSHASDPIDDPGCRCLGGGI